MQGQQAGQQCGGERHEKRQGLLPLHDARIDFLVGGDETVIRVDETLATHLASSLFAQGAGFVDAAQGGEFFRGRLGDDMHGRRDFEVPTGAGEDFLDT